QPDGPKKTMISPQPGLLTISKETSSTACTASPARDMYDIDRFLTSSLSGSATGVLPPAERDCGQRPQHGVGNQADAADDHQAREAPLGLRVRVRQLDEVAERGSRVHRLRQDDVGPGDGVHDPERVDDFR